MTEPARIRAGTTDRQAAVDQLSTHFADGRLDAAEFDLHQLVARSSFAGSFIATAEQYIEVARAESAPFCRCHV